MDWGFGGIGGMIFKGLWVAGFRGSWAGFSGSWMGIRGLGLVVGGLGLDSIAYATERFGL